jgi:DNA-binding transcriptional regulator YiaG
MKKPQRRTPNRLIYSGYTESKNAVHHNGGGQVLLEWRRKRNLRQSDVAKLFGVTPDMICKVETGQRRPGNKLLTNIQARQHHRLAADLTRKA